MSDIQLPLMTNDPFSQWATQVRDSVREGQFVRSSDMDVSTSPFGSYIGMRNDTKYYPLSMNYCGEFDMTASYQVNDVVRVLPNKKYSYPWDSTPEKDTDGTPGVLFPGHDGTPYLTGNIGGQFIIVGNYIPVPGTYVCTTAVPGLAVFLNVAKRMHGGAGIIGSAATTHPLSYYDKLIQANIMSMRFYNINYLPVYPEMPNPAYLDVNNLSKYEGRYWDLLSLAPRQVVNCVNGLTKVSYVDNSLIPSGSANYVSP